MSDDCCKPIPSNKVFKSDWKEVIRKDNWGELETDDWGSDAKRALSEGRFDDETLQFIHDTDEELFTDRFKEGIKCFYCDSPAEWKCINGLTGNCSYRVEGIEGDPRVGVQVCGANGKFALQNKDEYPEGHKSYALQYNSGHTFRSIEEYYELDPDAGWVNKRPRGE